MENRNRKEFIWCSPKQQTIPKYINREPVEYLPNPGVVKFMNLLYSELTQKAVSECGRGQNAHRRHTVDERKNIISVLFDRSIHENCNDLMQLTVPGDSSGQKLCFDEHIFKQKVFQMFCVYCNNQNMHSQHDLPGLGLTIRDDQSLNKQNRSKNVVSRQQNESPIFNLLFLKSLFNAKRPTIPVVSSPKKTKNYAPYTQWFANQKDQIPVGDALENQPLNDDGVPIVVEKCINFINSYGMLSEGIYRVNGNVYTVDKLMELFKKSPSKMMLNADIYDENDVASAFKKYMRELNEPLIGNLSEQFKCVSQKSDVEVKKDAYKKLMYKFNRVEYQTLRKIIEHLFTLQLQRSHNKMTADNLGTIWGNNLLKANLETALTLPTFLEKNVIVDLIVNFKDIFAVLPKDCQNEQILRQTYIASLNQSGDVKVWVKIVSKHELRTGKDENKHVVITISPKKTVFQICKELASQIQYDAESITMTEIILNGKLKRPMHPNEVIAETLMRWANWSAPDRQNNHFVMTLTKFFNHTEELSTLNTKFSINYADGKEVKSLKPFTLVVDENKITLRDSSHLFKDRKIDLDMTHAYLGAEEKWQGKASNSVTLVETGRKNRPWNEPLQSHLITSQNVEVQIFLYLEIIHSFHSNKNHYTRNSITDK